MSLSLSTLTSYGLTTDGFSHPTCHYATGSKALCLSGLLDVPIVSPSTKLLYKGPENNFDLTEFLTDFLRVGSNASDRYYGGDVLLQDTYTIYASLCVPVHNNRLGTLHFLTHGLSTNKSYWDFEEGYSYVDEAAEQGYPTFSYDRLGIGRSEMAPPIQVIQARPQVEIAHSLIRSLRNGSIAGVKFEHVIGMGHSLGSGITQNVCDVHPGDFDAVVLTAHSWFFGGGLGGGIASGAQQIALTLPDRADLKSRPNGYYILGPMPQALQFGFYAYPYFDREGEWTSSPFKTPHLWQTIPISEKNFFFSLFCCLLDVWKKDDILTELIYTFAVFMRHFKYRSTNTIGETLTAAGLYVPARYFTGPVLVLNGRKDYLCCQGDCLANNRDMSAETLMQSFPKASWTQSKAITVPDMGHNINLHLGRKQVFGEILQFVNGLGIGS